ncbi:MAG: PepSY domain-containing protein [Betaproteobacteria bacterium]|nr:MAG: PepSY domain-containing protein [Betaproteobacteria bacterium]
MQNRKSLVILAALSFAAFAGASVASETCTQEPKSKWLSQEAIAAKLKEQGFEVSRTETKRSCYEVKAKDAQGKRVELYVDPVTARVVKQQSKDRS